MVDFLRLPYFMKRRNAFREDEREKKVQAGNVTVEPPNAFTFSLR